MNKDEIDAMVDRILVDVMGGEGDPANALFDELSDVLRRYRMGEGLLALLAGVNEMIDRSPDPPVMFECCVRLLQRMQSIGALVRVDAGPQRH